MRCSPRPSVGRGSTHQLLSAWITHVRSETDALLKPLEVLPPRMVAYRGTQFEELDVDAVLERRPDVTVVDELAHRCAPGSRHEKRWEDVDELLDAGIDVVTSLNVQHIDSLNADVESAIGVHQEETVPDQSWLPPTAWSLSMSILSSCEAGSRTATFWREMPRRPSGASTRRNTWRCYVNSEGNGWPTTDFPGGFLSETNPLAHDQGSVGSGSGQR